MKKTKKLKKLIHDLFTVTPKEWVAVQATCAALVTSIGAGWNEIIQLFGDVDSDAVKTGMRIAIGVLGFVAAYAQTKTKANKE